MLLAFVETTSEFSAHESYIYRTKMKIQKYDSSEKSFKKINFLRCSSNLKFVVSFLHKLYNKIKVAKDVMECVIMPYSRILRVEAVIFVERKHCNTH